MEHLTAEELENLEYTLKYERGPNWTCQLSDEEAARQLDEIAAEVARRDDQAKAGFTPEFDTAP